MPSVRHPAECDESRQQQWLHEERPVRLIEVPGNEELRGAKDRFVYFAQPCTEQIAIGGKLEPDERTGANEEQDGCCGVRLSAAFVFIAPRPIAPELPGAKQGKDNSRPEEPDVQPYEAARDEPPERPRNERTSRSVPQPDGEREQDRTGQQIGVDLARPEQYGRAEQHPGDGERHVARRCPVPKPAPASPPEDGWDHESK